MKSNLEQRIDLLSHYLKKFSEEYDLNKLKQMEKLINNCIEQIEQEMANKIVEDMVRDFGLIPITSKTNTVDRLLVVDKVILLSSYKELSDDEIKSKLESEYGFKIFLIDSSRQNTQGIVSSSPFVYFT